MASSGQTINDRLNAARYSLAGQALARSICKATTEEMLGPKKKHLDYLIACTHEPNVSVPQMANLLIERTNHMHWIVVFKALITVHHLMSYGNERFTQYLASSNYSFELSTFLNKSTPRDFSMSTFIRRYSRYINEKALSYRLLAYDLCRVKRGNEGTLRIMPIERLLKTLPILQNQLDALLEFDCTVNDLNNGVINVCFMLIFRDLISLYACHNDGIINLLNKYFSLNKKLCREALDLYKKFLVRMDKVSEFLKVAEVVGIDRDDIPDLKRAPNSLVEALEQHLQNIESNKKHPKPASLSSLSTLASTTPSIPPSTSSNSNSNTNSNNNFNLINTTTTTTNNNNSNNNIKNIISISNNSTNSNPANIDSSTTTNNNNNHKESNILDMLDLDLDPPPIGNLEAFGNLLQPMSTTSTVPSKNLEGFTGESFNNIMLQPSSTTTIAPSKGPPAKSELNPISGTGLFKGDLDSTLASLAQNLTFDCLSKK